MIAERRIVVRCTREPQKHAKILHFSPVLERAHLEQLAELLDGTSRHYIHKPGPNSPVGKCAICGAQLECKVEDIDDGK